MMEPFYRFRRVRVTYGDPVDLSAFGEQDRRRSPELLQEAADAIMEELARLGGVAYRKVERPVAIAAEP